MDLVGGFYNIANQLPPPPAAVYQDRVLKGEVKREGDYHERCKSKINNAKCLAIS